MASGPITSQQIDGETVETVTDFIYLGSKITADGDCSHEIKRHLLLGRKVMTNLDCILKSRDITNRGPSSQSYGFSTSHVWMWELDYKESWALKNWCFWTVVLEKTFFIIYLFWLEANYFTILYWFCHKSTCICHRCTRVPHPEPPSHRPPHTIPLGHPSAPALSILYHASNLDWRFVSHMILYMFQCHSPKSSQPLHLP